MFKSFDAQKDAAKAAAQANEIQRKQLDLQAARQRRDAIREGRIAAAQATVSGEAQGVADSSSSQGGIGSITSQVNSNVSFLDAYNQMSDQAMYFMGVSNQKKADADRYAGLANFGMKVATVFAGGG